MLLPLSLLRRRRRLRRRPVHKKIRDFFLCSAHARAGHRNCHLAHVILSFFPIDGSLHPVGQCIEFAVVAPDFQRRCVSANRNCVGMRRMLCCFCHGALTSRRSSTYVRDTTHEASRIRREKYTPLSLATGQTRLKLQLIISSILSRLIQISELQMCKDKRG